MAKHPPSLSPTRPLSSANPGVVRSRERHTAPVSQGSPSPAERTASAQVRFFSHHCHQTHSRKTLFISGQRLKSHLKRPVLVKLKTQSLPLFCDGSSMANTPFLLVMATLFFTSLWCFWSLSLGPAMLIFSLGAQILFFHPMTCLFPSARSCMFSPRHRWV